METTSARMRQLQATDAEWLAADPTLLDGEIAFSSDLKRYKVGPGQWSTLTYWGGTDAPSDGRLYGVKSGQWVTAPEYASIYTGNLSTLTTGSSGVKFFRLVPPVTGAWPSGGVNGDFLMMLDADDVENTSLPGEFCIDTTEHGDAYQPE